MPGPTSGQLGAMTAGFVRQWHGQLNRPNLRQVERVPCSSLTRIMQDRGLAAGATFLSLDVEGAEALVLRTVNPALFQLVFVEWSDSSAGDKSKNDEVHRLLTRSGMHLWGEMRRGTRKVRTVGGGTNRIYARQAELLPGYRNELRATRTIFMESELR